MKTKPICDYLESNECDIMGCQWAQGGDTEGGWYCEVDGNGIAYTFYAKDELSYIFYAKD